MTENTRPRRRRTAATGVASSGPATSYIYRDENGEPLFRVVRGRNKRFFQERWEDGGWKRGVRGHVEPVLYNMPLVTEAVTEGRVVWLVEGEKDADALTSNGVVATTMPGGAGKWRDEYSYMLLGAKRVNVVWDNDEQDPKTGKYPGQEHALQVEASIKRVGLNVRLLRAKAGKDAYDHLEAGYDVTDFVQERPGPPLPPAETNGHSKQPAVNGKRKLPAVFQLALYKLREHAEHNNLPQPRETERGYEVCCPAHDDKQPSLGIMVGEDQPLVVNCQRGCTIQEIADALEIDVREFSEAKQPDYDADTERALRRLRADREARFLLASEAAPTIEVPMLNPEEYLSRPLPKYPYTVEELHITGSNTLVVSQYKVGKTTLMINLFRSLVNVEPFLGHFDVQEVNGKIAYLDYEMQESQFRGWLTAGPHLNTRRMVPPWHLRGSSLHFWARGVREQFVKWLQENEVKVLIIDTAARAWAGLVDNENDNTQMLKFTDTLDQVKAEANVTDLFLVTHMGRNIFVPEGEERARGATRLEDWMDSGWYYTKDETGGRYLRAIGRGVDQDSFALSYEPHTHSLLTSGVSRREHQYQKGMQLVVDTICQFDAPPSMTELKDLMPGGDSNNKQRVILEAETRGLIIRRKGQGRTMRCELTEAGLRLHERRIEMNSNGNGH